MDPDEARALFAAARVARLATVRRDGSPHLVPVCFAVAGDRIYSAVDHKPKRSTALLRLDNIAADPRVSLLADLYADDDWSALWWARADGAARVVQPSEPDHATAIAALAARYAQYGPRPPRGPAIVVEVTRWSGWRASA